MTLIVVPPKRIDLLLRVLDRREPMYVQAFLRETVCRELRRVHPPSKARRVAAAIRRHFQQPLNVGKLARSVNMTSSGLRKAFRAEFGRTLRNYEAAVRLLLAIGQIETAKVQGVALDVGYKSTKNFRRMFSGLTGLTPTEFRLLSNDDRREVMANAWKNVQLGNRGRRGRTGGRGRMGS